MACITDADKIIASKLFRLRTNMGIKLQDLAVISGIKAADIHDFETAQKEVPASDLFMLSMALGIKINYFYDDESVYSVNSSVNEAVELVS